MSVVEPRPPPGRAVAWLALANARIVRQPVWFVAAFAALYGFHGTDRADFCQLALHPFALHPDPGRQFLQSSPLGYFLAHPIARLAGPDVALVVVIAGGFATIAWGYARLTRALPAGGASAVALTLLSTPLLLVVTSWLGKTDPFLIGLYLVLVSAPRSSWARGAIAVAMVLFHREIASFVLIGHLAVHRRDVGPVLIGLAVGHLLVLGYHHAVLPAPPASRESFVRGHAFDLLAGFIANPLAHLVFALSWFWMLFAIQLRRRFELAPIAVLVVIVAAASVTLDYTRAAAMCALPIVLRVALQLASSPPGLPGFVRRLPFPLLFLVQFQIEQSQNVRDSRWLDSIEAVAAAAPVDP